LDQKPVILRIETATVQTDAAGRCMAWGFLMVDYFYLALLALLNLIRVKWVRYLIFKDGDGSFIGTISGNNSGRVQFNTTSDRRLKQNIRPYRDGLKLVREILPRKYERTSNPRIEEVGFIAQEHYEVFPVAVAGTPDDPIETPMMVDYSKLTRSCCQPSRSSRR
jgi:hypothetical protein